MNLNVSFEITGGKTIINRVWKFNPMTKFNRKKLTRIFLAIGLVVGVSLALTIAVVTIWPSVGAQGADFLRTIFGNKPVAYLEELVFKVQDTIQQIEYRLGKTTPSAPWQIAAVTGTPIPLPTLTPTLTLTPTPPDTLATTLQPGMTMTFTPSTPSSTPTITLTPSPTPWQPESVSPMGAVYGEGKWEPYIQDQGGTTVAYRTFLQPDSERPYVVIAAVAFDLSRVRLHYILGIDEPYVPDAPRRSGAIPGHDLQAGVLLAAFNGGFKSVNGHFGVMAESVVVIQPIKHMGTIAIYRDGSIRIGEWGVDMVYSSDMLTFRQNCPLMVQNGEINPLVNNDSVNDWGGTVNGDTVTFRSGIGISQDGRTLYYFAGQKITMPVLAKSMQAAGAYQAMQLDINNYYVHFTSFEIVNGQLTAYPLLPKDMVGNIPRFLHPYGRDFFYITAITPQP
jgi:hypothetical protein